METEGVLALDSGFPGPMSAHPEHIKEWSCQLQEQERHQLEQELFLLELGLPLPVVRKKELPQLELGSLLSLGTLPGSS